MDWEGGFVGRRLGLGSLGGGWKFADLGFGTVVAMYLSGVWGRVIIYIWGTGWLYMR